LLVSSAAVAAVVVVLLLVVVVVSVLVVVGFRASEQRVGPVIRMNARMNRERPLAFERLVAKNTRGSLNLVICLLYWLSMLMKFFAVRLGLIDSIDRLIIVLDLIRSLVGASIGILAYMT
jgi:hypothetical protein